MKRHLYDSIIKSIFNFLGFSIILFSVIMLLGYLLNDNFIHKFYLLFLFIGFFIILLGYITSFLLRFTKNVIEFSNGKVYYKNLFCDYNTIKYFKNFISVTSETWRYPMLYVTLNSRHNFIIFYITKKDLKKLIKLGYDIKIV